MGNATIYVKKTNGYIDRVITLLVTGCKLSRDGTVEYLVLDAQH